MGIRRLEPGDVGSSPGFDFNQPSCLEGADCLANRISRNTESLGNRIFEKPISWLKFPRQNEVSNLFNNQLAKWAMVVTERHDSSVVGMPVDAWSSARMAIGD